MTDSSFFRRILWAEPNMLMNEVRGPAFPTQLPLSSRLRSFLRSSSVPGSKAYMVCSQEHKGKVPSPRSSKAELIH